MSGLELFAATLGVIAVWLTVKQNPWCWPIGLVMVLIYSWIFYEVKLYSDMLLQVIYAGLQVYGWWQWTRAGQAHHGREVSRLDAPAVASGLALGALGSVSAIGLALIGAVQLPAVLGAARIVSIGHAIAMHRVVLPFVVADPVVGIDVVVAIDVDVDVVVAPVTVPPQRSHDRHAGAERQSGHQRLARVIGRWRWIVRGRRCRVGPGAVGCGRVVRGDVHHLRIGRLDDDGGVAGGGGRLRSRSGS